MQFKKWICCVLFVSSLSAQPWVMFNDLDDTYLYDQASGSVYIRVKKGGKNYEDSFVKMGVVDKTPPKEEVPINSSKKEQEELIKKAQEIQRSIQGNILGGGE
ncbi:hypothetical protein B6S12_05100 [Helicobacter valdiviensis]|uniref:Periplasmic protein n=1 Tax=Helicobacter valdiviensis TaxID=1458358 RepID=A0A2W6MW66_9HELI|nr:hypothetical protein [Helicobacter valdiviensis]PZT48199.1 hypothetical protein B6S12_05100 [Helicobacter valdiviensis]